MGSRSAGKPGVGGKGSRAVESLSEFMKCLKEPLARLANRHDKTRGAFFDKRFTSIAVLDEEALLSISVYIDLNPVAAGLAEVPETSKHTSIKQRVDHVESQGRTDHLAAAQSGSVAGSHASSGLEESHWLCPIEDRRGRTRRVKDDRRILAGQLSPSGRLHRSAFSWGKNLIPAALAGIFDRLGCTADRWTARLEKLRRGRLFGRFFAVSRAKLQEVAAKLKVRHLVNLAGCPAYPRCVDSTLTCGSTARRAAAPISDRRDHFEHDIESPAQPRHRGAADRSSARRPTIQAHGSFPFFHLNRVCVQA